MKHQNPTPAEDKPVNERFVRALIAESEGRSLRELRDALRGITEGLIERKFAERETALLDRVTSIERELTSLRIDVGNDISANTDLVNELVGDGLRELRAQLSAEAILKEIAKKIMGEDFQPIAAHPETPRSHTVEEYRKQLHPISDELFRKEFRWKGGKHCGRGKTAELFVVTRENRRYALRIVYGGNRGPTVTGFRTVNGSKYDSLRLLDLVDGGDEAIEYAFAYLVAFQEGRMNFQPTLPERFSAERFAKLP